MDSRIPTRLYVNVENVTDKVYATASSISFGTELLTPGAPRLVRIGVQVGF
jgi:outer membrane receptor protein involved in Fe transport